MDNQTTKFNSLFLAIISLLGWFAIFLQFYLIIINRVATVPETIVRFFSFFTIQTNLLVAVCFSFLWLRPKSKWGIFFSTPKNISAITLYILIVGIVYNLILRFLWAPIGFQKLADELLHSVIPILVLLFWLLFVDKKVLGIKNIFPWLIFPFLYLIYTFLRGHFFHFYPYPFVDVISLGYTQVIYNSFFMLIAFLVIGLLIVGIGNISNNRINK